MTGAVQAAAGAAASGTVISLTCTTGAFNGGQGITFVGFATGSVGSLSNTAFRGTTIRQLGFDTEFVSRFSFIVTGVQSQSFIRGIRIVCDNGSPLVYLVPSISSFSTTGGNSSWTWDTAIGVGAGNTWTSGGGSRAVQLIY